MRVLLRGGLVEAGFAWPLFLERKGREQRGRKGENKFINVCVQPLASNLLVVVVVSGGTRPPAFATERWRGEKEHLSSRCFSFSFARDRRCCVVFGAFPRFSNELRRGGKDAAAMNFPTNMRYLDVTIRCVCVCWRQISQFSFRPAIWLPPENQVLVDERRACVLTIVRHKFVLAFPGCDVCLPLVDGCFVGFCLLVGSAIAARRPQNSRPKKSGVVEV